MLITLSRQMGSHGDTIAARVAAALGLTLVDREVIYAAALRAGVPDDLLHKLTYEKERSLAGHILDTLTGRPADQLGPTQPPANPLSGIFAPMLPHSSITLEEGVLTVGLIIKEVASRGDALVLGQGAQAILRDYPAACHVLAVAPFDLRVQRVAEREKLASAVARRRVRANDLARNDYLARYHDINWLEPFHYHLIINTGQTPIDAAVSLIVHAAQAIGRNA
ncbi:MAG: cytidylate kinase-like family protein [Chloroflexi bacterium]|nr:cytidylate kinase-like family protein [Chloroflexota bacterium]